MMKLALEHAVGQKLMLSFVGTEPSSDILTMIQDQYMGGVTLFQAMNVVNPAQVRALTDALQHAAVASGHPPLFIAAEQEGGQLIAIGGTTMVARFCAAMVEGLQSSGIAAGVYINNRVRIASLFRGVPEDRYDEVRNLFLRIRDENEVLKSEFSELADWINIQLPDEKSRRVGQSVAAASLPAIDQENR